MLHLLSALEHTAMYFHGNAAASIQFLQCYKFKHPHLHFVQEAYEKEETSQLSLCFSTAELRRVSDYGETSACAELDSRPIKWRAAGAVYVQNSIKKPKT